MRKSVKLKINNEVQNKQKRNIETIIQHSLHEQKLDIVKPVHSVLSILRRKQVEVRTGLSRATIYARIAAGTFPSSIDLGGGRAVGWLENEIDAWLQMRVETSRKTIVGKKNEFKI